MAETVIIDPLFFGFEDEMRDAGRNGLPTSGPHMAQLAKALNTISHAPRTIYSFWGGTLTLNNLNDLRRFRSLYGSYRPGKDMTLAVLWVPPNGAFNSDQAITMTAGSVAVLQYLNYKPYHATTAKTYPDGSEPATLTAEDYSRNFTGDTTFFGSQTSNGPYLAAGLLYEPAQPKEDPALDLHYMPPDQFVGGADIIATAVGSALTETDTWRSFLNHTWNRKRPTVGWSAERPGATNYTAFTTSSQAFRYIHDQTVGDGGTAPSLTGPGITVPAYKAGAASATTVSATVHVYAAMSGATDTGTVGMAHNDGASGITSIVALTGIAITGTSYAWYSANTFLRTDVAYDRVVLCAKSSGATDTVRIAAFGIGTLGPTAID